ncbi:MAG: hypothetical protein HP052_03860 [Firmicutes bacterium]|nr:hypothetical protein [Bacillota bacterium]
MQDDILLISQISQMAAALLAGFGGGIAFDIYQRLCYGTTKRRLRPSAYIKGDLLFSLAITALWLLFWFSCTDGSLRVSVFIWLVIGFALYFGLFRQRVVALIHKLLHPHRRQQKETPSHKLQQKKNFHLVDKGSQVLVGIYQKSSRVSGAIKRIISHLSPHKEEKNQ